MNAKMAKKMRKHLKILKNNYTDLPDLPILLKQEEKAVKVTYKDLNSVQKNIFKIKLK